MAHFYGTLKGSREITASRTGTPSSGIVTQCASWKGAVQCTAYIDEEGVDCVKVEKVYWQGCGEALLLYDGPIGGLQKGQTEVFGSRDSRGK